MNKRDFLKQSAGAVLATSAAASIAQAQTQALPTIKWRLASSFPKSLDTIYGGAEQFAKRVAQLSQNRFQIQIFAGGELVPGTQVLEAVQNGTVECGHSASYYYFGKNSALAFDCAVPFGLSSRQQTSWMLYGGGMEAMRKLFAKYNVVNFLGGNTGTQMGGWFKKEIQSVQDLKGLKFRVSGFAGKVLSKLGVIPQQIPGGDIYPALEKGAIDAAEWVGPYDDEKLGFYKVAKHYYYPGWWEGSAQLSFYVSKKMYDTLPELYKNILEIATLEAHTDMQAKYDAKNPQALAKLLAQGVILKPFNQGILQACFDASQATFAEEVKGNPDFKEIFESWRKFRNNQAQWFNVAEREFGNFSFMKKY